MRSPPTESSSSAGAATSPARWSPPQPRVPVPQIERAIAEDSALAELVASVQRREVDPLTAADRVASAVLREATS